MKEDSRSRVSRAGEEINILVLKYQVREVCSKTQRWYQEAKVHKVPPTSEHMDKTSTLREDLYRQRPPEGENISILVQPVSIEDVSPEVGEIAAAVRKLRSVRAG